MRFLPAKRRVRQPITDDEWTRFTSARKKAQARFEQEWGVYIERTNNLLFCPRGLNLLFPTLKFQRRTPRPNPLRRKLRKALRR